MDPICCAVLAWYLMGVAGAMVSADEPRVAVDQAAAEEASDVQASDVQVAVATTEQLIAEVRPSLVTIRVQGRDGDPLGIGTGFVIDGSGLIATNMHVIGEGRPFTVETSGGRNLPVISIEASDSANDLAIIRVDVGDDRLSALTLSQGEPPPQGKRVLAFGNPLGLQDSVVEGMVSAVREISGREMIQLAMPVQPGNSGGPVVDSQGSVLGIVNMKSAVDDNLGFAIPIDNLTPLRQKTNPITMDRWVRLSGLDESDWEIVLGGSWQQRGGVISASAPGNGFGGRSLCLSTAAVNDPPYDISVWVRLDDESGAAGIAFHSDGGDRHYGFYPSNGKMRLTCFLGPSVYSWQVLSDVQSKHYLAEQWNHLRVRVEEGRMKCYVNEHLVVESTDMQLTKGRIGIVKFRDTKPQFRRFSVGPDLASPPLSTAIADWIAGLGKGDVHASEIDQSRVDMLAARGDVVSRELRRRAVELEEEAQQMKNLAGDVLRAPLLAELGELFAEQPESEIDSSSRLVKGALLISAIENPQVDLAAYEAKLERMAREIAEDFGATIDEATDDEATDDEATDDEATDDEATDDERAKRRILDKYLFQENGFHGGRAEYYHPANSFLDRVIDDREGLPITLAILYIDLGRRLGLQIEGIGLPGHFVVKQVMESGEEQLIDVFDGGTELSDEAADALVQQFAGRAITPSDLQPQSDLDILTRVLNNLIGIATREQDIDAMLRRTDMFVTLHPDENRYRFMRAQLRAISGRTTRAREDLDELLRREPNGINGLPIRELKASLQPDLER
ncbi:secreted protein containing Peptidase S1 and S6, chymotrypsin/Hap domain protein [Rhodopirellula maiorica SM1]|uniref:Secreted protein containing Peptidase S1 and S6, chymotrypsin/Hap domain protein n=1 Tax=Rhodopirellula maiorica SM1 TaxID=1265738 RepID=M5RMR6_9BACT|nr:secreted protein containing Peptidase S1 and S6, chymotrypsin/Hap domain protein [Rhodopirellula maiorica SM1]